MFVPNLRGKSSWLTPWLCRVSLRCTTSNAATSYKQGERNKAKGVQNHTCRLQETTEISMSDLLRFNTFHSVLVYRA
jgi:hypothetical protein